MRKKLSVLAGVAAAGLMATSAQAGLGLSASVTDGTLDGSMQTAVISITGGSGFLVALAGTPGNPMEISTGDGSNLYNHDTVDLGFIVFDGESPFALPDLSANGFPDAQFDSGFLQWAGDDTTATDGFNPPTLFGAFAFSDGGPASSTNVAVFDIAQGDVLLDSPVAIARVTWDRLTSLTFSVLVQFQTPLSGVNEQYLTIEIPAIPAPGAMALLGLAGICGVTRRRRRS